MALTANVFSTFVGLQGITGVSNNQNKYFAIKNGDRRSKLHKANFFFKFFSVILMIIISLAFVCLAGLIFVWLFLALFGVGSYEINQALLFCLIAMGASLLLNIILSLLNYIVDGSFIKKEMKELNAENNPENDKYITIGRAFLKLRKTFFICFSLTFLLGIVTGLSASALGFGSAEEINVLTIVLGVLTIIPMIVYSSISIKTHKTIRPEVGKVIEERRELKKLMK